MILEKIFNEFCVFEEPHTIKTIDVYEIELIQIIPGYNLPILLAVAAASTIGIIYIIRKKKYK